MYVLEELREERDKEVKRVFKELLPMAIGLFIFFTIIGLIVGSSNYRKINTYLRVDGLITNSWNEVEYSSSRERDVTVYYNTFKYNIDGKEYTNTTKGINGDRLPKNVVILVNPNNYHDSVIYDDVKGGYLFGFVWIGLGFIGSILMVITNIIAVKIRYKKATIVSRS